jgi:hypothetical protein
MPRYRLCGLAGAVIATLAFAAPNAQAAEPLGQPLPADLIGSCEDLAGPLAALPATVITGSSTVAAGTLAVAGQPVAAHCRVTGRMNERVSPVDGKTYAIGFEMRLPLVWNGRFFHQGNGGIDGSVVTATGASGGGPLTHALQQGFAVLSSDAGHNNAQGGPAFGFDPQARLDYGYQAVGTLTPMAKRLIAIAYGRGPDHSYFGGCSNGGRHTLVAAARYAADYDGFLAGAPGYNLPLAAWPTSGAPSATPRWPPATHRRRPGWRPRSRPPNARWWLPVCWRAATRSTARSTAWCRTPPPASATSICCVTSTPARATTATAAA